MSQSIPSNIDDYVDRSVELMGLFLSSESRAAVIRNVATLAAIAQPVLEFELTPVDEIAPVFTPTSTPND
jgi:hypothetical protein